MLNSELLVQNLDFKHSVWRKSLLYLLYFLIFICLTCINFFSFPYPHFHSSVIIHLLCTCHFFISIYIFMLWFWCDLFNYFFSLPYVDSVTSLPVLCFVLSFFVVSLFEGFGFFFLVFAFNSPSFHVLPLISLLHRLNPS